MTKLMMMVAMVAGLATGCAARPAMVATPAQRAAAVTLYLDGATSEQVADRLAIAPEDATELLHSTIVALNRRYYRVH